MSRLWDAVFDECTAILNTLALGGHARPQSLLAVLRDEIHPEIRRMREAILEIGGIADGVTARAGQIIEPEPDTTGLCVDCGDSGASAHRDYCCRSCHQARNRKRSAIWDEW